MLKYRANVYNRLKSVKEINALKCFFYLATNSERDLN